MKEFIINSFEFITTIYGYCPVCEQWNEVDTEYGNMDVEFDCQHCGERLKVDLNVVYGED